LQQYLATFLQRQQCIQKGSPRRNFFQQFNGILTFFQNQKHFSEQFQIECKTNDQKMLMMLSVRSDSFFFTARHIRPGIMIAMWGALFRLKT